MESTSACCCESFRFSVSSWVRRVLASSDTLASRPSLQPPHAVRNLRPLSCLWVGQQHPGTQESGSTKRVLPQTSPRLSRCQEVYTFLTIKGTIAATYIPPNTTLFGSPEGRLLLKRISAKSGKEHQVKGRARAPSLAAEKHSRVSQAGASGRASGETALGAALALLPRSSAPAGQASPTAGQYPQQRASLQDGRAKSSHVAEAGQRRTSSTGCQGLGRRPA